MAKSKRKQSYARKLKRCLSRLGGEWCKWRRGKDSFLDDIDNEMSLDELSEPDWNEHRSHGGIVIGGPKPSRSLPTLVRMSTYKDPLLDELIKSEKERRSNGMITLSRRPKPSSYPSFVMYDENGDERIIGMGEG